MERYNNRQKNNKGKRLRIFTRSMKAKLARLFIGVLVALVGLGVVITRIYAKSGEKYEAIVLSQQTYSSKTLPYRRGNITDRDGNVLATSIKVYNMIIDPKVILTENKDYLEPTVDALVKCFGYSKDELTKLIQDNKDSRYVIKEKQLKYEQIEEFKKLMSDTKNNPDVKGVWFEEEYKRMYPYSTLASGTIGFTVAGNVGNWGIEEYYNDYLNGIDGREYGYVNEDNTMDPVVKEPTDGNTVVSTIDLNLQTICEKYIKQWVEEYHPTNVAVVMADPNTGEILAMADSNNMYDLNNPQELKGFYSDEEINAMSDEQKIENLSKIWRNFCVSDTYEAGSTIKPFTIAGALEDGKISKDQTFLCDGGERISGFYIKCHKTSGHGTLNVEQAIMNSCNDSLMQIAAFEGVDTFCKYQSIFGFGMRSGIDLPGEASCEGLLYTKDNMQVADLATNSFGQNFNVNMIQMVAGFSSLINGGYYYKPHVVKQILNSNGGVVANYDKELIKQTITKDTSDFLRQALVNTVNGGTGKTAAVEGYDVGGKTGTAQHHDKSDKTYLLSFLGFAPYDNPKVVCYTIVDAPQVDNPGSSSYACKLFSAIMTEALPYMDVFPTKEVQTTEPATEPETTKPEETQESTEPTVPMSPSDDEAYEDNSPIVEDVEPSGDNVTTTTE
ncbi:MAG: penicillin-binding protein 2 [Clostridiales bacterium]|nr:penicillin-binding protein 2 [Clostridiales bacterium]